MKSVLLFAYIAAASCAAQSTTAASSKPVKTAPANVEAAAAMPVPAPVQAQVIEHKISAAFRTASVEALSCLESLSGGILEKGPGYGIQKFHCAELVNRCHLILDSSNKTEKSVYGPMGLLELKLDLCRGYAESGTSEQFGGCVAEARDIEGKLAQAITQRAGTEEEIIHKPPLPAR
jgi:hypothetical protein